MNNGLNAYVKYWSDIFLAKDPSSELEELPQTILQRFQTEFYPEPYYGYFHEDMTNDVLLLLLNPGHKESMSLEENSSWNHAVRERYTRPWSKNDYLEEEGRIKSKSLWRFQHLQQARGIVGNVGFLHTMEFFPYHSKTDKLPASFKDAWMSKFHSTKLAVEALKDIATNKKVKHILSTNADWPRIFALCNVPLKREVELKRRDGKSYSFNFKVFQFNDDALPMLMCNIRGNSRMDLPTNPSAVKIARILLGISDEPIPTEDSKFQIMIKQAPPLP